MGGKSTKKGKAEATSKPEETSTPKPDGETKPAETAEAKPTEAAAESDALTLEQRIERIEKLLLGGEVVAEGELVEGQMAEGLVTVDDLESRFLAPLLERIERLEEHGHLGAPPELPEALEVRVRGKRRRFPCAGQVFTRDWKVVHPKSQSQIDRLRAEYKAGTIEVREAR